MGIRVRVDAGSTSLDGDRGGGRGSEGLAGDATSLGLGDDGLGDVAGLRHGADGLGEDNGVSHDKGNPVGFGDAGQGGLVSGWAVGNCGSTAGDGVDLSGDNSEGGHARVGRVGSREVQVSRSAVSVGESGKHAEDNSRLHLEGLCVVDR